MEEIITYMGYQWLQLTDGTLTIGVNEDGIDEIGEALAVKLPEEGDSVSAGQVCGEIETESGPMNIYCPVDGIVSEVNGAVAENPRLILEDCLDEGWLLKVDADDPSNIDMVSLQLEDDGADPDDDLIPDEDDEEI